MNIYSIYQNIVWYNSCCYTVIHPHPHMCESWLPASHCVVSVEHLLAEFLVLDASGEFNMCKLVPKQLRFEEALDKSNTNMTEVLQNWRSKMVMEQSRMIMNKQDLQWEFYWDNNTGDSPGTVAAVFHFLVWIQWTWGWPHCCGQLWLCGEIILF